MAHHVGGQRAPTKVPSGIDFPTLSFSAPETDAHPFLTHYKKRGMDGEVPPAACMYGMIETYDNGGETLFTLAFYGADVLGVTPDRSDSTSEEIKQVKVELYTERMAFAYA